MSSQNSVMERIKRLKILYVEDEKTTRENIASVLRMYCSNVKTSTNGYDALNEFVKMEPDIIITDIEMLGVNGLELATKIRERSNKCKIIVTTAYTDTDLLLKATELHLTKYLVKPISTNKLFEALELAVEQMDRSGVESNIVQIDRETRFNRGSRIGALCHLEKEIEITNNEYELLLELTRNIGEVVSKELLMSSIWKKKNVGEESLRTLVKNLKKKIPAHIIKNVKGVGYMIPKFE